MNHCESLCAHYSHHFASLCAPIRMSVCEQVCLKPPEIGLFYRGIGIPAAPVLTEVNPDESLCAHYLHHFASLCAPIRMSDVSGYGQNRP